jgi:hypothetical protein
MDRRAGDVEEFFHGIWGLLFTKAKGRKITADGEEARRG